MRAIEFTAFMACSSNFSVHYIMDMAVKEKKLPQSTLTCDSDEMISMHPSELSKLLKEQNKLHSAIWQFCRKTCNCFSLTALSLVVDMLAYDRNLFNHIY